MITPMYKEVYEIICRSRTKIQNTNKESYDEVLSLYNEKLLKFNIKLKVILDSKGSPRVVRYN